MIIYYKAFKNSKKPGSLGGQRNLYKPILSSKSINLRVEQSALAGVNYFC